MSRIPTWRLPLLAVVSLMLTWTLMKASQGNGAAPVPVPLPVPLVLLVMAIGVLLAGRAVWRTVRGQARRPVHPLTAFRIAVGATAAAYAGALLAGWYAGQALALWPHLVGERTRLFYTAWVAVGAALLLSAAGLLARRWCRPPVETTDDAGGDRDSPADRQPPKS